LEKIGTFFSSPIIAYLEYCKFSHTVYYNKNTIFLYLKCSRIFEFRKDLANKVKNENGAVRRLRTKARRLRTQFRRLRTKFRRLRTKVRRLRTKARRLRTNARRLRAKARGTKTKAKRLIKKPGG
jgi:hypothetical protein